MGTARDAAAGGRSGKPLDGVLVADLTHAVAGPLCTSQLRAIGADVVKVERPGPGDDMRHYTEHAGLPGMSIPFIVLNGGKRSITVNLKSAGGQQIIRRLAAHADVVVENFRPGVADSLGVGWEDLKKTNERLVYCSVTGFGQSGPLRDWPAYDHIVQAASGMMMINGEPGQGPLKVGIPLADLFAGHMAAFAILAALAQRDATGLGQRVDVAMLDSLLTLLGSPAATYLYDGEEPRRTGNRGFRLVATSDTYRTADGYLSIGANHQAQFEALCRILGEERLLGDPRFADHRARVRHGSELREELQAIFETRSAERLETELAGARVPASKVRSLPELLDHPHVRERGLLTEVDVPGAAGPVRVVGPGFRLTGASSAAPAGEHAAPAGRAAVPALGQHTDEVLREIGFSAAEISRLREDGAV